ncbi:hypothetical protein JCM3765_005202 [Sporobolomyces pararoseus]
MSAFQQLQPQPHPSQPATTPSEQQSMEQIPPPPPPPTTTQADPLVKNQHVELQRPPPTPPPSLPSIEQSQQQLPPPPSAVPPPPAIPLPLPSEIVQPPQLQQAESTTSVTAEPPTPLASTPAPQQPQPAQVNGVAGESHAGLGMGMHGEGQPGQSAVDVLADVAMGEAAMDLAGFAAGQGGGGSGDVKEEGGAASVEAIPPPPPQPQPQVTTIGAEPSPPLKRSFEESSNGQTNGSYFSTDGLSNLNGGRVEVNGESRETKRPRVEEQIPHEPSPGTLPQHAPSVSVQPPSVASSSQTPAPVPQPPQPEQQQHAQYQPQQASASSAPSSVPNQNLDPSLGGPSPLPAPSAPSPSPAVSTTTAAPTMSPSELHHFPGVVQQPQSSSNTPLPPHQPSPAPSQPQQQPTYDASSNAFAQQQQQQPSSFPSYPAVAAATPQAHQHSSASPYPSAQPQPHQTPSASPYPPPVASTSTGAAPSPVPQIPQYQQQPPQQQHQASPYPPPPSSVDPQQQQQASSSTPNPNEPPPAEPIAVMTKEQQKHAINLVRNLKRNKNASPFLKPVDHIALHIPDYYKIITQPMDLGTVESRLQATGKAMTNVHKVGRIYGLDYSYGTQPGQWEGQVPEGFEPKGYRTVQEFKEDLDRVWNNCFRYNGPRDKNPVSAMAGNMMDAAEKNYRGMPFAPAVSPYPPRHVEPPKIKQEPRPAPGFIPTIRRDDASSRPKREIHAPVKDLAYLDSADPNLAQYQQPHHQMMGHHQMPGPKARNGRKGGAQEQLRYCKETIKELFKKTHESYAYPFYQPVDLAAYPTYTQYVSRPMDLSTIRSKLEHNQYPLPPYDAFESDVRQIFENCFAFNPAGTLVHGWGRQLEAVFEFKWADRPMDDGDDFSDDDGLNVMEQQLQMLAANIEQMRQNKKAQKEAKRFQQAQQHRPQMIPPMPPSMVPKPPKKSSTSTAYNPYGPPRPQPKKSRPSGGGGGGQNKKKKRRDDDDSDDYYEDDGGAYYGGSGHVGHGGGGGGGGGGNRRHAPVQQEEWVDFEMKRELAVKIVTFEGEQLEEAINIIRRGRPDLLGAANQEVELDIDQLDQRTLVALYRYVCPGAPVAVRPVENAKPAKQQTSNKQPRNQRKNLDEDAEAARIAAMEQQLEAFSKGSASTPAAGSALPPTPQAQVGGEEGAGGGGDQASSDSSDEASSDSDSDED